MKTLEDLDKILWTLLGTGSRGKLETIYFQLTSSPRTNGMRRAVQKILANQSMDR